MRVFTGTALVGFLVVAGVVSESLTNDQCADSCEATTGGKVKGTLSPFSSLFCCLRVVIVAVAERIKEDRAYVDIVPVSL
jgi:hypothetical protein